MIQSKTSRAINGMNVYLTSLSFEQFTVFFLIATALINMLSTLLVYMTAKQWVMLEINIMAQLVLVFASRGLARSFCKQRVHDGLDISTKFFKGSLWAASAICITCLPILFAMGKITGPALFLGEWCAMVVYNLTTIKELWTQENEFSW